MSECNAAPGCDDDDDDSIGLRCHTSSGRGSRGGRIPVRAALRHPGHPRRWRLLLIRQQMGSALFVAKPKRDIKIRDSDAINKQIVQRIALINAASAAVIAGIDNVKSTLESLVCYFMR